MEYLNIEQAAKKLDLPAQTIATLCKVGCFGRKLGNTWCITNREISHYSKGHRSPPSDLEPLYDSQQVIAILGISRAKFYRLVAEGQIVGEQFGRRGGQPNLIFTLTQVAEAHVTVQDLPKNGYKELAIDKYIQERDGRFYVTDQAGTEHDYKSRTIARSRARMIHS
jgi:hypothetical protein